MIKDFKYIISIIVTLFGFGFAEMYLQNQEITKLNVKIEVINDKLDKNIYYTEKNNIDKRLAEKRVDIVNLEKKIDMLELKFIELKYFYDLQERTLFGDGIDEK